MERSTMNAATVSAAPSRWRLSPREENTAEMFLDEKRIRNELAGAEWNRDIAIPTTYVFGIMTALLLPVLLGNSAMRMLGYAPFLPPEGMLLGTLVCPVFMVMMSIWRLLDRYIAALKVIHQQHAAAEPSHEMFHV